MKIPLKKAIEALQKSAGFLICTDPLGDDPRPLAYGEVVTDEGPQHYFFELRWTDRSNGGFHRHHFYEEDNQEVEIRDGMMVLIDEMEAREVTFGLLREHPVEDISYFLLAIDDDSKAHVSPDLGNPEMVRRSAEESRFDDPGRDTSLHALTIDWMAGSLTFELFDDDDLEGKNSDDNTAEEGD